MSGRVCGEANEGYFSETRGPNLEECRVQTTRPRSAMSQRPSNQNARFVIHPGFKSGEVIGQQQTPGKTLEKWTFLQAHHN